MDGTDFITVRTTPSITKWVSKDLLIRFKVFDVLE